MPSHLPRRVLGAVLLALALTAGAAGLPVALELLRANTGEESLIEGLKGAGALALIELTGRELELAELEPAAHLDVVPYGANTFLHLEVEPANVRRTLELMAGAGIGWARQHFPWEDIEVHARGDFEDRRHLPYRSAWDKYDAIVAAADDYGVELLVRLDDPPEWAYSDPAAVGDKGPPDDLADFDRFAAVVAERYCGRVRYFQIWNEPNIYPEWGERDVDPAGYALLLASAAAAVRGACPGAVIVSAALAPTTEPGGRNMDDLAYLEALYGQDWGPHFDVLAVQGFGLWTGPRDRRASRSRTNFARILLARDIMVRAGDGAKPVWIAEMGWNSPPPDLEAPNRDNFGRASEALRARYTVDAFERMAVEWPFVGVGFVWFMRRPDWEWHQRAEGWFRLVDPDWTETSAYRALAEYTTLPPRLNWGRHLPGHPALVYSGPWRRTAESGSEAPVGGHDPDYATGGAGGGIVVGTQGAEVAFSFQGRGAEIRTAVPVPDAEAPRVFEVVDGFTRHVEPAPGSAWRVAEVAGDDHTVILRVDRGSLALAEVVVEGAPQGSFLAPGLLLALAGGVILSGALAGLILLRP